MCLVADLTNVHGDLLANKNTKFNKAVSQHQQFGTIKQMFTVIFFHFTMDAQIQTQT